MMRIAIIASGSRGDVQPYVALGKGLAQAGHAVRLVTRLDFETLVNAHGLEFWPVAGNVQNVAQSTKSRQRAADLGAKIQAEDGVARAVAIIQDAF